MVISEHDRIFIEYEKIVDGKKKYRVLAPYGPHRYKRFWLSEDIVPESVIERYEKVPKRIPRKQRKPVPQTPGTRNVPQRECARQREREQPERSFHSIESAQRREIPAPKPGPRLLSGSWSKDASGVIREVQGPLLEDARESDLDRHRRACFIFHGPSWFFSDAGQQYANPSRDVSVPSSTSTIGALDQQCLSERGENVRSESMCHRQDV